jgi:pyruvyltransferase
MNYIPAYWCLSSNFGDNLNHYLISQLSNNKHVVFVSPTDDCEKYMCIGSILNHDVKNCNVWGSGVANSNDIVAPKKKIFAVRGKLTGNLLNQQGIEHDEVYGDPALLLPLIYYPKQYKTKSFFKTKIIGIIPHYVDAKIIQDSLSDLNPTINRSLFNSSNTLIKIIDVNLPIERFINEVTACDSIISSSLHGLICADAYGIPSLWAKFSNNIGGDDFKYHDYYSSIDAHAKLYDFRNLKDIKEPLILPEMYPTEVKNIDEEILKKLWNSCPFLEKNKI